jgi:hypothetical protein
MPSSNLSCFGYLEAQRLLWPFAIAIDYATGLGWLSDRAAVLAIVPGLFVGIIFSSFLRCRTITFYDLHAIDADRFTPPLKTAFGLHPVPKTPSWVF